MAVLSYSINYIIQYKSHFVKFSRKKVFSITKKQQFASKRILYKCIFITRRHKNCINTKAIWQKHIKNSRSKLRPAKAALSMTPAGKCISTSARRRVSIFSEYRIISGFPQSQSKPAKSRIFQIRIYPRRKYRLRRFSAKGAAPKEFSSPTPAQRQTSVP